MMYDDGDVMALYVHNGKLWAGQSYHRLCRWAVWLVSKWKQAFFLHFLPRVLFCLPQIISAWKDGTDNSG